MAAADRPKAESVAFLKAGRTERLTVLLRDGRLIAVPLDLYPSLKKAKPSVRKRWRLVGRGQGIHWPGLDLDLSTEGIVNARPDRTLAAQSGASGRRIAQLQLKALAEADRPITISELATLLGRALTPARLRQVLAKLEHEGRLRDAKAPRRQSA